jgi:hypothetical protein
MRYSIIKSLVDGDATQATVTSAAIEALSFTQASVVAKAVGGTITGVLKVQVSNDQIDATQGPINWVDTAHTVNVTGAGNFLIPAFDCAYAWVRLVYTKTTSASGAKISANIKSNGY